MNTNELIIMNGIVVSEIRKDGYVNATRMCQSAGKRWNHYASNAGTQSLIASFERSTGIPANLLVQTITDGPNEHRGTWVHPHIAIHLASWCDADFAAVVCSVVFRYATGQITTEESKSVAAKLGVVQQTLPPPDVRVANLTSALQTWGITPQTHPRWQQAIQDFCGNLMGIGQENNPGDATTNRERWRGVVEIAEEMGFKEAVKNDVRTALGRFVSSHRNWNEEDTDFQRKKEERLCNGTMRKIWVYNDTPQMRELIRSFFDDE
jgi:hypothetical protein